MDPEDILLPKLQNPDSRRHFPKDFLSTHLAANAELLQYLNQSGISYRYEIYIGIEIKFLFMKHE